jgi:hypothetical protein
LTPWLVERFAAVERHSEDSSRALPSEEGFRERDMGRRHAGSASGLALAFFPGCGRRDGGPELLSELFDF